MFFGALIAHFSAAMVCIVSGVTAALARKRPGVHPRAGDVYLWALAVVIVSASTMAVIRFEHSGYLLVLAFVLLVLGILGWMSRPNRHPQRVRWHAMGMGGSFIVLLTGFYVDNGNELPVWEALHPIAYWTVPALVGIPLIVIALRRYRSGASRRPRRRLSAPAR